MPGSVHVGDAVGQHATAARVRLVSARGRRRPRAEVLSAIQSQLAEWGVDVDRAPRDPKRGAV